MVDAAEQIFGDTMQVANAWYAVGVGTEPTQVYLSGPSIVCSNGTAMTVNYLPANASIIWNNGSYITVALHRDLIRVHLHQQATAAVGLKPLFTWIMLTLHCLKNM